MILIKKYGSVKLKRKSKSSIHFKIFLLHCVSIWFKLRLIAIGVKDIKNMVHIRYGTKGLSVIKALIWLTFWGSLFGILVSCSFRQVMIKEMTTLMDGGLQTFEQDHDFNMLRQAMPAHIKLAEAMLAQSPEDKKLRVLLARLYGSYAFAFEETDFEAVYFGDENMILADNRYHSIEEMKQNLSSHYKKGANYAKSALILKYPDAEKALGNNTLRDEFIHRLTKEDVPALFWYGFNLGGFINLNLDSVRAMAMASQTEAAMQRVIALSSDYYYGTAHMVLMIFHSLRPPMLGGRIETAVNHFKALKSIAGDRSFLADVLYARYCLPRKQDRSSFETILDKVSKTHLESSQPLIFFNKVAAIRAQIYLKAVDQLFDD